MREALEIQRRIGDGSAGCSLSVLVRIAEDRGEHDAAWRVREEAVALLRGAGSKRYLVVTLADAGRMALLDGDHARARPLLEEAVTISRERTPGRAQGVAACALAYLLSDRGEYDTARALLAEGLTIECELRSKQGIQRALHGFVYLATAQ